MWPKNDDPEHKKSSNFDGEIKLDFIKIKARKGLECPGGAGVLESCWPPGVPRCPNMSESHVRGPPGDHLFGFGYHFGYFL